MEAGNIKKPGPKGASAAWGLFTAVLITAIIVSTGAYLWHRSATRELRNHLESRLAEYSFFTVYGADPYTITATTDFGVAIPEEPDLRQRLQILANVLSRRRFGNLPMEVIGIEERGGKTIALVNLKETDWNRDILAEQKRMWNQSRRGAADSLYRRIQKPTWRTLYFQGSCGGGCTTIMLVQTFLQRDYGGIWIDGVEFHYEGEPISDAWDHISLSGIKYRQPEENSEPSSE